MSDTIVVMNQGYIQQIGTPEMIYNEPTNAFVADFIGDSNIIDGTMIQDKVVEILGVKIPCVDEGFGNNTPVDVVIRPEDIEIVEPEKGLWKVISPLLSSRVSTMKSRLWQTALNGLSTPPCSTMWGACRNQCHSIQHPDHEQTGIRR